MADVYHIPSGALFNSYKGWLKHCDSYRLYQKYMTPLEEPMQKYYEDHVKRKVVRRHENYQRRNNRK